MIRCACGQPLIARVGEGFVVTLDDQTKWMRRRSDVLQCRRCGHPYRIVDLVQLPPARPAAS